MFYRIFETDGYIKDLEENRGYSYEKIYEKLKTYIYPQLKEFPFQGKNIKKLKGYKPDTWRYRIGKLRIFYEIDQEEKIVYMIAAKLRKDAY